MRTWTDVTCGCLVNDKVLPCLERDVQEVDTVTAEERLFCAWEEHMSKLYTHFFTFV